MEFLPFALHSIGQEEIDEVVDTLKSNWLTTGPKTSLFEKKFAEYVGVKNAYAVNSCTAAMHLSLEAAGIKENDQVITSPFTFAATSEVIRYLKAKPVFIDCDENTMNINVHLIEKLLESQNVDNSKIKAIIPVHIAGQACDMDDIIHLAQKYNLKIIEDAAHALPTTYNGQLIGTIGDLTCFSFYATKTITTGEGGMITTNNDEFASRIKTMRLHGINNDVFNRYISSDGNWYYEVVAPGFKYNMTDIAAAIGIQQLKKVDKFQAMRQKIADRYNKEFGSIDEIEIPFISSRRDIHAWHLYIIKLKLDLLNIDRSEFIIQMKKEGIGTSVHFIPLHIQPYYKELYHYKPQDFPVANNTFQQIVSLPIYPKMNDMDIEKVIRSVKKIIQKNKKKLVA